MPNNMKTFLSVLGLVLTFVGAWVAYINSPINEHLISGGTADTDFGAIDKKARQNNFYMGLGMYAILAGTMLQTISNFVP